MDSRKWVAEQDAKPLLGGSYATHGNALAPPVAQSPLANVIDNLRRKVNTLEAMHDAMQQKLAPILVSVPEAPMKEGAGITCSQSAVVMELSELEYRLGILCRKIDALITRIEA